MGKAKQLKIIRRAAAALPAMSIERMVSEVLPGSELIANGMIETKEGALVEPGKKYRFFHPQPVPIDHAKEMKKMYLKHGGNGVVAYVKAAKRKEAQLKAEYDSKAIQASQ